MTTAADDTSTGPWCLHRIGVVESSLLSCDAAQRQGDEGAPDAWIAVEAASCSPDTP